MNVAGGNREPKFIRINNKVVRLDAISFVDFLESGRAMVVLSGLPPEKAYISVDFAETRVLREYFDLGDVTVNPGRDSRAPVEWPRPLPIRA